MRTKEILSSPFSQEMLIVAQEKIKALDKKKNQILDKIFMESSASLQDQPVKEHPIKAKPVFVKENQIQTELTTIAHSNDNKIVVPAIIEQKPSDDDEALLHAENQIQTAMTTIAHSNDNKIVAPAITEQKPSDDDEALLHAWECVKGEFINENLGANDVPLKAVEIRKWMDENKDYLNSVTFLHINTTQNLPDWFFNYFKGIEVLRLGSTGPNNTMPDISLPSSLAETDIDDLHFFTTNTTLPDWVFKPTVSGKVPMPGLQRLIGPGLRCADYDDPKRVAKVDYFFRSHPALLINSDSFTEDAPLATTDIELWHKHRHKHKNDKIMSVILKICVVVVASLMLLHMMNKT